MEEEKKLLRSSEYNCFLVNMKSNMVFISRMTKIPVDNLKKKVVMEYAESLSKENNIPLPREYYRRLSTGLFWLYEFFLRPGKEPETQSIYQAMDIFSKFYVES